MRLSSKNTFTVESRGQIRSVYGSVYHLHGGIEHGDADELGVGSDADGKDLVHSRIEESDTACIRVFIRIRIGVKTERTSSVIVRLRVWIRTGRLAPDSEASDSPIFQNLTTLSAPPVTMTLEFPEAASDQILFE